MTTHNVLALDIGGKRIGLATMRSEVGLAKPLGVVENNEEVMSRLQKIVEEQNIDVVVVGLPRNLNSEDTEQTLLIRDFAKKLQPRISSKIEFMDEALTSQKAEEELKSRGKAYSKGDIDALSACYILEDFLNA